MKALWKRLLGAALPIALAATVAGVAPALSHRDETLALGAKITKISASEPIFAAVFDEAKKGNYVSPTAEIPTDKLKWLAVFCSKPRN